MIIKKIILQDFFRFYGYQEINCDVNNDKNVIVIVGENGRGKTTLLSAFNWVFYDEVLPPLNVKGLLNYKRQKELNISEQAEAFVTIIFEEDGIEYEISRKLEFQKRIDGSVVLLNNKSIRKIAKIEENGNILELNYNITADRLLIPKDLSGFFFFDGERISRLAKIDGKKEIKNAILNLLGISYIDYAQDHLEQIKKSLTKDQKKLCRNNADEIEIGLKHTETENYIENITKEIDEKKISIEKSNKNIERLDLIIKTSNIESVKELEKRNKEVAEQLKNSTEKLKIIEKNIKQHIAYNLKYYLMHNYIEDVEKLLDVKRKEGRLPANIKDTFIDDLIKRGSCICGTCLKEDSLEYNNVKKLREQAGSRELDDAYYDLKNIIGIVKEQHSTFFIKLNELVQDREQLKNIIFNSKEELKLNEKQLQNMDIDEVSSASASRELLKIEVEQLTKRLGVLEDELERKKTEKISLEKTLNSIATVNKEVEKLRKKIRTTEKIITVNTRFKEMFTEMVREELDFRIKDVFAKITNKSYRAPVLTKDFELKIVNNINDNIKDYSDMKEEILSTGEEQITSLSFIGALVSYAKDKRDDMIMSKLTCEEYPIVMDSPFGNLDEVHTQNVAKNIGKLAAQVLIVVSKKQWEGYVQDMIKDQVIRSYQMVDGDEISEKGEYTIIK